jgi:hypothetical protein
MVEKVMGQAVQSSPARKIPPMYDGGSGWGCTYRAGDVRIDFAVYEEASSALAKHTHETYSVAADNSKGRPSIGDSAYWVTNAKREPYLYVLKGKVHFSIGMSPGNETQMRNLAGAAVSGI